MARWMRGEGIEVLVDATHAFSTRISENAVAAAKAAGVPLLSLVRPAWARGAGDLWIDADSLGDAALALGEMPRRVLLTIGRQEVAAFKAEPQHRYLIRSIEPPEPGDLPPDTKILLQRGPFSQDDEVALFRREGVETIVSKNAGGTATAAKLAAARTLGLPVVMIARPDKPAGYLVETVDAAADWLEAKISGHLAAPSERGV
ncbi:Precorrin-6A reductase [Methyloligella halotolerans]|uniref:Precorrin-6A reductase n=2 Tax=Methyloligella halotolerans TaxID=1177755 RepID=A0A1E2S1I5_9HYPH|nr:Precorrin-6A reductase [Methyloligella halotolerans]